MAFAARVDHVLPANSANVIFDPRHEKSPGRVGPSQMLRCCLNVGRAADDHLARGTHAVVLVAMCVGGCDERFFVGTSDARSAKRARYLFRHTLS